MRGCKRRCSWGAGLLWMLLAALAGMGDLIVAEDFPAESQSYSGYSTCFAYVEAGCYTEQDSDGEAAAS